jgi:SEC-C motif
VALMQWLKNLLTPRSSAARGDKLPGRNEPCWCGSGKKYKQCHLRKDTEQRIEDGYAARAAQMAARNAGKSGITPGGSKAGGAKAKAAAPQEFKEWKGGKGQ